MHCNDLNLLFFFLLFLLRRGLVLRKLCDKHLFNPLVLNFLNLKAEAVYLHRLKIIFLRNISKLIQQKPGYGIMAFGFQLGI